jgi:hypothetical protein
MSRSCSEFGQICTFLRQVYWFISYTGNYILGHFMIYYGCDACPLSDCVICHILSHLQIGEYMSRSCSEFVQKCTFLHQVYWFISYTANYILGHFMTYYGCDACPLSDCVMCHILRHLQTGEYMSRSCSEFGQICTFLRLVYWFMSYIAN